MLAGEITRGGTRSPPEFSVLVHLSAMLGIIETTE